MLRTACSLVFVCALGFAAPVSAQDAAPWSLAAALGPEAAPTAPVASPAPLAPDAAPGAPGAPSAPLAPDVSRPAPLVPLYASFAMLQALDYHSTRRALADGSAREANPLMRSIVKNPPAFIAVKAAATAGVIVLGERMWKKSRVGAVLFVAGTTAAMAVVVGRNYAVR